MLGAEDWEIVRLSLRIGTCSTIGMLPVSYALAYVLARWRSPLNLVLDVLVTLPLVLPPVVTGYALLVLFGRAGPLGRALHDWLGVTVIFRWTGAAIAAAIMALPLMVRVMRVSIEAVDRRLEGTARTLGAGPLRAFFTVTLPLSAPGILAGVVLGFAKSLGEFGATITFVSNIPGETRTLPIAMYTLLQAPGGESRALTLAMVSLAISLVALFTAELIGRRLRSR